MGRPKQPSEALSPSLLVLSVASVGGEVYDLQITSDSTVHALFACVERVFEHNVKSIILTDGQVLRNLPGRVVRDRFGDSCISDPNFAALSEVGFHSYEFLTCELGVNPLLTASCAQ